MKRYLSILIIALFVFVGCSDKKKYDKAVFIFEKHSMAKFDSSRIRDLLNKRGFAGLKSVDRYAHIISPKKKIKFYAEQMEIKNTGALFDGTLDEVYIRRVFKNSPAAKNNMRDGDKVLSVDYDDTKENTDNVIKFKLKRRSIKKPFYVSVKKERFFFPKIFGFPINKDSAYIRVGSFFKGSSKIIEQGLSGLIKTGASSIIIDLRYNGMGSMRELSQSLDIFYPAKKLMFSAKSRVPGYTKDFHASSKEKFPKVKFIILVNKDTSMSGEIFAQALKENNKAFIIGSKTAGKVSIQKIFKLSAKEGLSLSVSKLMPASGIDMEGHGIVIDFKIEAEDERNLKDLWLTGSSIVLLEDPYYKEAVKRVKLHVSENKV
jgi:carboxyl-terminal processing protease